MVGNESAPIEINPKSSNKASNGQFVKLIVGMLLGIFVLIGFLLILDSLKLISLSKLFPSTTKKLPGITSTAPASKDIIANVGDEYIYQQDLSVEEYHYPTIASKTRETLLKKLITDSITLQAAAADSLITLDASIYNTPTKNYDKRIATVKQVKEKISARQEKVKGSLISVWFYNDARPTTLEANKAKEIAFSKINPLYNAVKAKQITPKQAAQQIQSDTSLATIDVAYKSNAILEFEAGIDQEIVFDKDFESKIRQLQPGQVSDLVLIKDLDIKTKQPRDAVYMFAQVDERKGSGTSESFDDWYKRKEGQYAITTY